MVSTGFNPAPSFVSRGLTSCHGVASVTQGLLPDLSRLSREHKARTSAFMYRHLNVLFSVLKTISMN